MGTGIGYVAALRAKKRVLLVDTSPNQVGNTTSRGVSERGRASERARNIHVCRGNYSLKGTNISTVMHAD